jgi:Rrf2 family protein
MKLSTRGRYGLAAMCELARRPGSEAVPLHKIASEQSISEGYLEQLFLSLRRAGLVKSVRGAQGGYTLARDASEITPGDVLRVLEGPIAPVPCVEGPGDAAAGCTRARYDSCLTRRVWERLAFCMSTVLDGISLADLIAEDREPLPKPCRGYAPSKEVADHVRR